MNRLILVLAAALATAAPAVAQQENRVVVTFESDSDVVSPQARAQIAAFARQFRTMKDKSVEIVGHATLAESEENSAATRPGCRTAGPIVSARPSGRKASRRA